MTMPTYVTNLVYLIGLGIAIDYSLLDRLPLPRGARRAGSSGGRGRADDADRRAARSIFSGATVAIGLALLLFMPLPFIRSIGVGGFLIPLVSIARGSDAAAGAARRSTAGAGRSARRVALRGCACRCRRSATTSSTGFWARLARSIMRRPVALPRSSARRCSSPRRFPPAGCS